MALCSNSQYARYRRCNPSSVTRAIQKGRIRLTSEGYIDTADADARWPLDCEPDVDALPDGANGVSREEAERRKVLAQAQLAELELRTKEGQLLPASDVLRAWQSVLANLRASLRNLPPRLAADMHGLDLVAAEAVALAAVDALLSELSDNPPEVK